MGDRGLETDKSESLAFPQPPNPIPPPLLLLNPPVRPPADHQLLPALKTDVFAALADDAARADARADHRADGRALRAAGNRADHRADATGRADLRHVVLRRALAAHAALLVNVAHIRVRPLLD